MTQSSEQINGNVYAVETMGMFDGPGVRYVLFLQGCPFRCKFCHNRDSWSTALNKSMSVEDVFSNFSKYKTFYKKGGITVSGGEPLLQINFLIALFKRFKAAGIHTCLDTSGGLFNLKNTAQLDELLRYTDLILLDIKHINDVEHQELVGTSNKLILEFARYLSAKNVPVVIRHVLVPFITAKARYLHELRLFLDSLTNVVAIDILPYHTKGIRKWKALGLEYPLTGTREPNAEEIAEANTILKQGYALRK